MMDAIIGGLVVLAAIVAAWLGGKRTGRKSMRDEYLQNQRDTKRRIEDALERSRAGGGDWHDRLRETDK